MGQKESILGDETEDPREKLRREYVEKERKLEAQLEAKRIAAEEKQRKAEETSKNKKKKEEYSQKKEHVESMRRKIEDLVELQEFLVGLGAPRLFYYDLPPGQSRARLWIAKNPAVSAEVHEALGYTFSLDVFGKPGASDGAAHDVICYYPESKEYFDNIKKAMQDKYQTELKDYEVIRAILCCMKSAGINRMTEEPKNLSWMPDRVCTQYFAPDQWLQDGPFPLWEEFMGRFTSPTARAAFMSWVWSIFEEEDPLRCVCHIQGPANSGKSALARTLSAITKNFCMTVNSESFNNQFSAAKLYTKRVATWDDCRYYTYLMKELIHSAVAGGMVDVERKNQNSFSAKLHIKLLVMSNYPPKIDDENNARSRLMFIKLKGRAEGAPIDPTYDVKLQKEFPYFLCACREMYGKTVVDGYLPEETQHLVECFTLEQTVFADLCEYKFVFEPDCIVEQSKVRSIFNKFSEKEKLSRSGMKEISTWNKFEQFLFDRKGVTVSANKDRRKVYRGMIEATEYNKLKANDEVILA